METPRKRAKSSHQPWQVQIAKARFSEVFQLARSQGPQWITRRREEAVVVVSSEEFERLAQRNRRTGTLVEFFRRSPLAGAGLNLERVREYDRPIDL